MKTFLKIITALALAVVLFFVFIAAEIYFYDENAENQTADAALVLGAAVWGKRLSPVFQERVNHAVELYRQKRVRKIIFTGGRGNPDEETEAATARKFALASGVAPEDILLEEQSASTYQNLAFAKPILDENGFRSVLLVSDPLHMKRSMEIARSLGYEAYPSPTPTTRYRGFMSQSKLLAHETYFYTGFLIKWAFNL